VDLSIEEGIIVLVGPSGCGRIDVAAYGGGALESISDGNCVFVSEAHE